jgi:glycosyltransferase involved in cell wall biosynthesis
MPYRFFLPRLDAHLYVGERNRAYLKHYGVPDERLFFAPHFVDNQFFAVGAEEARRSRKAEELRRCLGIPRDAFVYVFVGKFAPVKRAADFIRAGLGILNSDAGKDVHLVLVGDGPLRDELEQLAGAQADKIHFLGFQNQSQMPVVYAASNALVLTSQTETWGLVVNEAFACGIPAIVSDTIGCIPDLIHEGETGFTYPLGDIAALEQRMLELKGVCRTEPAHVGKRVAAKADVYSLEKATEGLEQAVQALSPGDVREML